MLNPALFSLVAAGSPIGRSSTAQGLFGASGTLGFVVASLATGAIAEIDIRLPFYVFAIVMTAFTTLGLRGRRPEATAAVGRSGSRVGRPDRHPAPTGNADATRGQTGRRAGRSGRGARPRAIAEPAAQVPRIDPRRIGARVTIDPARRSWKALATAAVSRSGWCGDV